jgi:hypothetical protein
MLSGLPGNIGNGVDLWPAPQIKFSRLVFDRLSNFRYEKIIPLVSVGHCFLSRLPLSKKDYD